MTSWWKKSIFIALIVAIAIPTSLAHKRRSRRWDDSNSDDAEQYLRDLCSETDRSDACFNIVKSELHRFNHIIGDINDKIIDLALEKSKEFRDQLKQWHKDSNDERLKKKYRSCSSNYNDINRDLQELQRNLDSDDDRKTSDLIKDIEHELDECKREFGRGSFDPGHVEDRNNELGIYFDLVRVAIDRLEDFYKETNHQ